jgi:hypothetical protein
LKDLDFFWLPNYLQPVTQEARISTRRTWRIGVDGGGTTTECWRQMPPDVRLALLRGGAGTMSVPRPAVVMPPVHRQALAAGEREAPFPSSSSRESARID